MTNVRIAFKSGVSGYLIKTAPPTEFVSATHKVAAGGKYVTETPVDVMVKIISGEVEEHSGNRLSNRAYDIFRRLASGQTVTKIGEQLQIRVKTVGVNCSRILKKW